jgi:hypothetical protein
MTELMEINEYYSKIEVLFEIVKQMQGKEVAMLGDDYNVRCIKAHNVSYLQSNFRAFNFAKRKYNIYISSAHYNNMPAFSYNPKERREQQKDFNERYQEYMTGYDFFIDIDGIPTDFNAGYEEAKRIKELFDDYKVPYSIKLSGKGFHIIVPSEYMTNILPDSTKRSFELKKIFLEMRKVLNLKLADGSVYDNRRVYKVAYSLDVKTGRVALPLSDEQFNSFNLEMVDPKNVLIAGVRNRGLLIRNDGNSKGFEKFYKDFSRKEQ